MSGAMPLGAMCLLIGKLMMIWWNVLCTSNVPYLNRSNALNTQPTESTSPIALFKMWSFSFELMLTTCGKTLKLRLVPLFKWILTVDQVTAPVKMLVWHLSTSRLVMDPQEMTLDVILDKNAKSSLKIRNMSCRTGQERTKARNRINWTSSSAQVRRGEIRSAKLMITLVVVIGSRNVANQSRQKIV